jgi:hypothetical protein
MVLLEASTILQNVEVIISIVLALITLGTTAYAVYQKIKAKDYKGAAEEAGKLRDEAIKTIDKIKTVTDGMDARHLVKDVLKASGEELGVAGLKGKMDAKVKELGLNEHS